MSSKTCLRAAVLISLAVPSAAAHADTLEYVFTGSDVNGSFLINTGLLRSTPPADSLMKV